MIDHNNTKEQLKNELKKLRRQISDLQEKEKLLFKEKKLLNNIINSLPGIFYLFDDQGHFLRWNKKLEKVSGYSGEEISKMHPLDFVYGEHKSRIEKAIQEVLIRGESTFEADLLSRDGKKFPHFFTGSLIQLEDSQCLAGMGIDISQQKRIEKALQESEEKFRGIFNNARDGIILADIQTKKFFLGNAMICQMLGYSLDELMTMGVEDIHPAEALPQVLDRFDKLVRQKTTLVTDIPVKRKDGRLLYADINSFLIELAGKTYLCGFFKDITERKQAEEAARRREAILDAVSFAAEHFLKSASWEDGIDMVLAKLGQAAEVSRVFIFENHLGKESTPLATQRYEWVAANITPTINDPQVQNVPHSGPFARWVEILSKGRSLQGHIKDFPERKQPLLVAYDIKSIVIVPVFTKEKWWGFIGFTECLAEREWSSAEIEALKTAACVLGSAIRRNWAEGAFKDLVFRSPVGIFIVQDGKFVLTSPGFQKISGYSEDELRGKDSFSRVVPEYQEMVRKNVIQMLKEESSLPFEFQVVAKNGERKWILETVSPTIYDGQRAVLGFFMDIAESKKLQTQFLQAQKMEAVGRLAGGVAHDFNNLLTAIMGYSEMLLLDLAEDDPRRHYVAEIINTADRASAFIRQLLAFGRKQIIQPRILNLNEIISGMEKMLRRLLGEDLDLITLLDPGLGTVKADPGQMDQVILNLAVNARDAMPGGGMLTIETENVFLDEAYARRHLEAIPGPHVMLAVSDTGMGMDPATQARVFEPFFTTKEPGKGTGLGLCTVFGIVKQSGGHIWFYSEPGKGTTFKIYLPRMEEAAMPLYPVAAPVASLRGPETILVAEDDENLRSVICETLRSYGYKVLEARHGNEAILVCGRHQGPIHLVLTDVVMPGMSGEELMKRLAPLGRKMKVVYMSGYTEDTAVLQNLLATGAPFLEKPFKPLTLLHKLRQVLDEPR